MRSKLTLLGLIFPIDDGVHTADATTIEIMKKNWNYGQNECSGNSQRTSERFPHGNSSASQIICSCYVVADSGSYVAEFFSVFFVRISLFAVFQHFQLVIHRTMLAAEWIFFCFSVLTHKTLRAFSEATSKIACIETNALVLLSILHMPRIRAQFW